MEYGVQTHNKFAFLDEDVSDPEEILTKAEEEKKKAAANPQQKKTVVKPSVVQKPAPVKEVNKQVSSGPKVPSRPRRPQPNASQNQGFDAPNDKEKRMPNGRPPRYDANKDDGGDGRPPRRNPPRGGGQSRGGASGPRGPRRPQREHTGENKAEEPNPNVNEVKTDENQVENTNVEAEQKTNDENVENAGEEGKEKQAEEENEDQVPRGKTLEEYRAEMNQKIVEAVQFNTRKAGEGDDQKIYQKLVPLKKPEQNKQEEEEDAQHVPKEKREKTLSIDVAFLDKRSSGRPAFGTDRNERPPPRGDRQGQGGGGGRRGDGGGGRGGYGGGGQRGPPRGNYGSGAAGPSNRRPPGKPNQAGGFTLETDQFPALGAK